MKSFFFGIKFNLHEMNERKAQRKKKERSQRWISENDVNK